MLCALWVFANVFHHEVKERCSYNQTTVTTLGLISRLG